MISYYIISSYLFQLDKSAEISQQMTGMLRNGTFSKYMVIPVQTQDCIFGRHWSFNNGSVVLFVPYPICAYCQLEGSVMWNRHGCFRTVVYGGAQLLPWDFDLEI